MGLARPIPDSRDHAFHCLTLRALLEAATALIHLCRNGPALACSSPRHLARSLCECWILCRHRLGGSFGTTATPWSIDMVWPSALIRAGHSGQITRIVRSHCSSIPRNRRGREYYHCANLIRESKCAE